jgi:hypothetical protein
LKAVLFDRAVLLRRARTPKRRAEHLRPRDGGARRPGAGHGAVAGHARFLALAGVTARTRAELEAENLRRAIDSRDVIGQAKGILMQRRGIGADEAFDLPRRTSQQLNAKLAELAHTLATRHAEIDLPRAGRE